MLKRCLTGQEGHTTHTVSAPLFQRSGTPPLTCTVSEKTGLQWNMSTEILYCVSNSSFKSLLRLSLH